MLQFLVLLHNLNKEKKLIHSHDRVLIADLCRVLPHMFQCRQQMVQQQQKQNSHNDSKILNEGILSVVQKGQLL